MVLAIGGLPPAPAADWARFRGPNGSAVSDARGVPTEWSDLKNVAWKTELPGPGSSSPIIVGERVFVTCYSGYGMSRGAAGDIKQLQRHLICVSLKDGKINWDKPVASKQSEDRFTGYLQDHGYATSTPASDGEHVFVFFGKSGVLAFDLEGNQLWQTPVGSGSGINGWGSGSSPILYRNTVIVNAAAEAKSLIALDNKTGKEAWRSDADSIHGSWATPVLVDAPNGKTELVVNAPYEMWGFNPDNGDFLWFAEGVQDMTICGSLVARDGIVYAIGGRSGSAVAVKSGGRDDVSKTHVVWKKSLSSYVPSPVLAGDRILSVNERGIVGCLHAKTGEQIFQQRLSNAGGVYASPVVIDGKAYVVTRRNGTFVVNLSGMGESIAENKLDDDTDFNASPAVTDGKLLLRSNRALYCIANKSAK
ncbi:MAG: PQQ-like beta-propeller repeat protein [Planctomycetaceae bacterium]|nr:PQQ-like beta-propeller repeat protein [Planctomycetaceae bacterium]